MTHEPMDGNHPASINRILSIAGDRTGMLRLLDDFACAIDSPELADSHRRMLTERTELRSNHLGHHELVLSLRSRTHPVYGELRHPIDDEDEENTPALIARAVLDHDEAAAKALNIQLHETMRALAFMLGRSRPATRHSREARQLRVALPNPWQDVLVTDGNHRPVLTRHAMDRMRPLIPGLYRTSFSSEVRPRFRKPIEVIRISRLVYAWTTEPIDDPVQIMRLAAMVPVTPDDILPDTGKTKQ